MYTLKHASNRIIYVLASEPSFLTILTDALFIWDKIFKSGLNNFCGRQFLKIYLDHSWILCPICFLFTTWKVSKYGVISGPYFSVFGLNTERYSVSLRIQSGYRKIRTRNNSVFGHFSRCDSYDYCSCLLKWENLRQLLVRSQGGQYNEEPGHK